MVSSALLALLIYLSMWIGWVQDWAWLGAVDDRLLEWGRALTAADPALVSAWDWFCTLLGPAAFRIIGVGIIIWLLIRRNWRTALFLVATIELSGPLIEVAKRVADRPRPDGQMVYAYGTAFPSGHALGVMVSVLAFLTVAWPMISARWRLPLAVLGAVVVIAIGAGRVVLNVHHPSDVLAGWALGYVYYVACLPLLSIRAGRPEESGTAQ